MSFLKYRRLAIGYCVLILLVSSIPGHSLPEYKITNLDKLIHLVEYSILGWFLLGSLEQKKGNLVLMMICIGIFFGAIDEVWQWFIPGRFSSVYDWIVDSIGIITGGILNLKFQHVLRT